MAPHGNRRATVVERDGELITYGRAPAAVAQRIQVATRRSAFADGCVPADPAVLRGRKAGNAVLVAGDALDDFPARAGALHGPALNQFSSGAEARLDEPR